MEYKNLRLELKAIDQMQGIVEATASTVGVLDFENERIMPGAFTKTIQEAWDKVLLFYKHNHKNNKKPIGKVTDYLKMVGDELRFKGKISKTQDGIDTLILLADQVITELSIGFEVIKSRWVDGVREILEVKLFEISFVDWGCNPKTAVLNVKSLFDEKFLDFESAVDRAELMSIPWRLQNVFGNSIDSILWDSELSDGERYNLLHDTLNHFNERYFAWIEEAFRTGNLKGSPRKLDTKSQATLERDEPEPQQPTPLPAEAVDEALLLLVSEMDTQIQNLNKSMEV